MGGKNGWLGTLLWTRRIPTPTKHRQVAHMAQNFANVPHTIRLWKLGQIQLRIDESGGALCSCAVCTYVTSRILRDVLQGTPIVGSQRCGHGLFYIGHVGYDDVGTGM